MKKLLVLFSAALLCLTACEKKEVSNSNSGSEENNSGKKKTVVIGVSANYGQTKVIGADAGTQFNFTWEKGDKIKITDDWGCMDQIVLELKTGAGTSSATFEGEIPELYEGDALKITYPVEVPDLNDQTYIEGKIASGLMQFTSDKFNLDAEGKCNVELKPQYAILQLNLYGVARSVRKIEVKDVESSGTNATLNCTTPVKVGKDKEHATPFYIVIAEAGTSVQLQIDVTMNEGTPDESYLPDYGTYGKGIPIPCKTFVQSSEKIIPNGTCVYMPAISLTTIWAPVNCGYDPDNFKYGKFYQWGRKDGSGYIDYYNQEHGLPSPYDDAGGIVQNCPNPGSITSQITESEENPNYYYNTTYILYDEKTKDSISYNTDWLSNPNKYRWDATGGSEAVHFATKGDYDPCPEGWRVPTKAEMATLLGSNTSTGEFPISTHGSTEGVAGRWFNASTETTPTTGVFLPVVGYRNSLKTAACAYRQTVSATYWTSSASGERACSMGFGCSPISKPQISTNSNRSSGFAVRCVQE